MKEELINKIISTIQLLGAMGISAFALLAAWRTWLKEKSIGASKVIELMEADKKMSDDIEKLKRENNDQSELIDKLDRDYRDIVTRFFDFLKK